MRNTQAGFKMQCKEILAFVYSQSALFYKVQINDIIISFFFLEYSHLFIFPSSKSIQELC